MKRLLLAATLALSGLSLASPSFAASAPTAPGASGAALAGAYAGTWKGRNESGGDLHVKLARNGAAEWVAEMSFTFGGAKVPTKLKSVRVEGTKVELVFSWEIDGTPVVGKLTGELEGATLQGKYDTDASDGAGEGSWKVTRT